MTTALGPRELPFSPLRIACELRGSHPPPLDPPPVSWRAGLDISPLDPSVPEDARWLHACLWPDQPERHARLEAAIGVAREHPVKVRRGDALTDLPGLIAEAPEDALVCVFHTAVLLYFTREQIGELNARLQAVGRDVAWVAGEAPGILTEYSPGKPLHFVLSAGRPGALVPRGHMGHHGGWLEWLG